MLKKAGAKVNARLRKLKDKFEEKGNERLTLMVIPHKESKILSLQLSKITIGFIILFFFITIMASILSIRMQVDVSSEVDDLQDVNQTFYYESDLYHAKYKEMVRKQEGLKNYIYNLFQFASLDQQLEFLYLNDTEINRRANEQMEKEVKEFKLEMKQLSEQQKFGLNLNDIQNKMLAEFKKNRFDQNFSYHRDVVLYRKLLLEMKQTIKALKGIEEFISNRISVQNGMPYYWPLAGGFFTSSYGYRLSPFGLYRDFHTGLDIAADPGTPVYATADGVIASAGDGGGYGWRIIIEHRFGFQSLYAHMSSLHAYTGQMVSKGQMIGRVGSTGRSTGPHLHYELKIGGQLVDPKPYVLGN